MFGFRNEIISSIVSVFSSLSFLAIEIAINRRNFISIFRPQCRKLIDWGKFRRENRPGNCTAPNVSQLFAIKIRKPLPNNVCRRCLQGPVLGRAAASRRVLDRGRASIVGEGIKGTLIVAAGEQWRHRNYRYTPGSHAASAQPRLSLGAILIHRYVRRVRVRVHTLAKGVYTARFTRCYARAYVRARAHPRPSGMPTGECTRTRSGCDSRDVKRVLAHLYQGQEKLSARFSFFFLSRLPRAITRAGIKRNPLIEFLFDTNARARLS